MDEVLFSAAGNPDSACQDTPLKAQGNDRLRLEHPRAKRNTSRLRHAKRLSVRRDTYDGKRTKRYVPAKNERMQQLSSVNFRRTALKTPTVCKHGT